MVIQMKITNMSLQPGLDADDHRLFCGDLGNEVNDEVLTKAFTRFATFNMARVWPSHLHCCQFHGVREFIIVLRWSDKEAAACRLFEISALGKPRAMASSASQTPLILRWR